MAAAPIPGSYPDSIPPTPDETMHQPVQSEQQHHHRQRNKLHKPDDYRGHRYTDSGVGITDPQPVLASRPAHYTAKDPEAAGGGGISTWDSAQPIPVESTRTSPDAATPWQDSAADGAQMQGSGGGHLDFGTSAAAGAAGNIRSENIEETSRTERPARDSAPYWGNLPRGADGSVYNRVVGHGSATDDHAEHHHLPTKSASSERFVIHGSIADYPRGGGVYNTVTGHGSQEQESRRLGKSHKDDDAGSNFTDSAGAADALLAAPLPDIPEERQRTDPQATFSGTPEIPPDFLPDTAVRDDVLPAEAAPRDAAGTVGSMQTANKPPQAEQYAHRTLPLVSAGTHSHDKRRSESPAHHGALPRATGLRAGVATPEYADERKTGSPVDEEARQSRMPGEGNGHRTAGVVTGKRRPSRHRSPVELAESHEQDSPKSEKKHKVLGIFHRHKDNGHDGTPRSRRKSVGGHAGLASDNTTSASSSNRLRKQGRDEPPADPKVSPSSTPRADTGSNNGHGKAKAATGGAAAAGVFGLLHRKRHSVSEHPPGAAGRVSGPLAADAGAAGPAVEAPRQVERISTPFEHPREPPLPPDAGGQPGNYNVLASGTPSGIKPHEPGKDNALASETPSGANAVATAGISGKDTAAREPEDFVGLVSSGRPSTQAARMDVLHQEAGDYNTLMSSGTSPAEQQASSQGPKANGAAVTREPGHYNTLGSGVSSGVKRNSPIATGHPQSKTASACSEGGDGGDGGDGSAEYNVLSSGTPSGVRVKPMPPHHTTRSALHADNQSGERQYNALASGTASGINPETRHSQLQDNTTSRAEKLRDLPAPANQHAPFGALSPSHGQRESKPNRDQGSLPDNTTYSHAELVHNMSPEVMPAAYTASVPRSSPGPSQTRSQIQTQTQAISPEVIPPANSAAAPRQSAPGPAPAPYEGVPQGFKEREKEAGKGIDPALAAATSSWATSAGKSSGVLTSTSSAGARLGQAPGQGRVVHRCLHCGRDNDISGYFAQFGPRPV